MWKHMARIICEVGPQFVFVENSSVLTSRGLGVVLGDLASMGFDARWCVLGAADIGANHQRDRIWIVAKMANPDKTGLQGSEWLHSDSGKTSKWGESAHGPITECCAAEYGESNWWDIEPSIQRVADGVAARVDRLKAIGNGQVPKVAATAWKLLSERI
jgi:DNA (cytosine-5)-methyltransferase 1